MRLASAAARVIDTQRGHLFPWAPVAFGTGVAWYFALPAEPGAATGWAVVAVLAATAAVLLRTGARHPMLWLVFCLGAGAVVAGLRTHSVAAPVLTFRYYGPVEGRIVHIDRSRSDKVRLTLDRVILSDVPANRTPSRVRVSLHGAQGYLHPEPGQTVILTGHLSAPGGPVEPGGFDFRRQAWFAGLGGIGYTRTPALLFAPAEEGRAGLFVHRLRNRLSSAVQAALPGHSGAFAAAITTGDRSAMDEATLEALRISNLAHLLAISGLHMGLLTGFVYAATRYGMALVPALALRVPTHKIGAVIGLAAGAVYLALSGGSVATERAYIMVAVMLGAVLFDRRALSLRAVALAAMIVLLLRPESLLGPGFQMSFAATAALIGAFGALRHTQVWSWHPVARWAVALLLSSLVAGLATAPFAAAHFNRVPHYGLLANLLSVPVMGFLVMPAAVLAAVLAPFGLGWIGLKLMSVGIVWILGVAERVSALEGSASHVVMPGPEVLPVLGLGGLLVILWQGRARWLGLAPVALAFLLWSGAERPHLLISDDGGLVGLMTDAGRSMSKAKGSGFAASSWLENDGDGADQARAFQRAGFSGARGDLAFTLGTAAGYHVTGRGAADRARDHCRETGALVIAAAETGLAGTCNIIDRNMLATTGPLALYVDDAKVRLVPADRGGRPWHPDQ